MILLLYFLILMSILIEISSVTVFTCEDVQEIRYSIRQQNKEMTIRKLLCADSQDCFSSLLSDVQDPDNHPTIINAFKIIVNDYKLKTSNSVNVFFVYGQFSLLQRQLIIKLFNQVIATKVNYIETELYKQFRMRQTRLSHENQFQISVAPSSVNVFTYRYCNNKWQQIFLYNHRIDFDAALFRKIILDDHASKELESQLQEVIDIVRTRFNDPTVTYTDIVHPMNPKQLEHVLYALQQLVPGNYAYKQNKNLVITYNFFRQYYLDQLIGAAQDIQKILHGQQYEDLLLSCTSFQSINVATVLKQHITGKINCLFFHQHYTEMQADFNIECFFDELVQFRSQDNIISLQLKHDSVLIAELSDQLQLVHGDSVYVPRLKCEIHIQNAVLVDDKKRHIIFVQQNEMTTYFQEPKSKLLSIPLSSNLAFQPITMLTAKEIQELTEKLSNAYYIQQCTVAYFKFLKNTTISLKNILTNLTQCLKINDETYVFDKELQRNSNAVYYLCLFRGQLSTFVFSISDRTTMNQLIKQPQIFNIKVYSEGTIQNQTFQIIQLVKQTLLEQLLQMFPKHKFDISNTAGSLLRMIQLKNYEPILKNIFDQLLNLEKQGFSIYNLSLNSFLIDEYNQILLDIYSSLPGIQVIQMVDLRNVIEYILRNELSLVTLVLQKTEIFPHQEYLWRNLLAMTFRYQSIEQLMKHVPIFYTSEQKAVKLEQICALKQHEKNNFNGYVSQYNFDLLGSISKLKKIEICNGDCDIFKLWDSSKIFYDILVFFRNIHAHFGRPFIATGNKDFIVTSGQMYEFFESQCPGLFQTAFDVYARNDIALNDLF